MDTLFKIIGLIAAVLTTASFIPQAFQVIKTKNTKDISLAMYVILVIGLVLWVVYGFIIMDMPLLIANIPMLTLCAIILILKTKYK